MALPMLIKDSRILEYFCDEKYRVSQKKLYINLNLHKLTLRHAILKIIFTVQKTIT